MRKMAKAGEERRKRKRPPKRGKPGGKARRTRAKRRGNPKGRRRANLIWAIAHPLRRRILRAIADSGEPLSPTQVAKELALPVGTVAYHAKVLWRFGAIEPAGEQQVRGAIEHFYDSTVTGDRPIETLLEETREVDEEDA